MCVHLCLAHLQLWGLVGRSWLQGVGWVFSVWDMCCRSKQQHPGFCASPVTWFGAVVGHPPASCRDQPLVTSLGEEAYEASLPEEHGRVSVWAQKVLALQQWLLLAACMYSVLHSPLASHLSAYEVWACSSHCRTQRDSALF